MKLEAFINPQVSCITKNNCMKDLKSSNIVGVFRSHALTNYLSSITKASPVEIQTMEQGLDMLTSQRINALIFPIVNTNFKNNLQRNFYESMHVETITEIDLYLWLEEEYAPYITRLNTRIKTLKSSKKWQELISPE